MKNELLLMLIAVAVCTDGWGQPSLSAAAAGVLRTTDVVTADGKLDEAVWSKAEWQGNFSLFKNQPASRKVVAQTAFALVSDGTTLYVGVRCREPDMREVLARPPATTLWGKSDTIEVFFAPSGKTFDFYHFAAAFRKESGVYSDFASEGGNIHPDPYRPDWKVATAECESGWSMEMAFPLSAFYMTRNRAWSETWLVNVCRKRAATSEHTSWSQLRSSFNEPDKMRPVTGFPKRLKADDVAMYDISARIGRRAGKSLAGTLAITVFAGEAGDYELTSPFLATTTLALKAGENKVSVPASYPANGRHPTRLVLTRKATGARYVRTFPVVVDFEDIRVKLTKPQYRDNFYPGQDASKVAGRVACAIPGAITLVLEGPGLARTERTLSAPGAFEFATPGFRDGTATLTVLAADGTTRKTVEIRKLAPTGHTMAWIEDGHMVIDGKPILPRSIYATGYRGGQAFDEKFAADTNLWITPLGSGGGTLEPDRVIRGLERREAQKDVMPCKEYFDKIRAKIEANRDRDFVSWYISDEPECRGISHIYLRHIYEFVKKHDPYHVIHCASRGSDAFNDCADWIETHPYLNPSVTKEGRRLYGRTPGEMGAYLEAFHPEENPDKCIGFLPTLFAYRFQSLENDYPTFREYVCHTWAAMVHGGKSLWPYAYHDMGDRASLYEGNRYIFSSFAALEDFVILGKRTWLEKSDTVRAVTYELPAGKMFVVVNVTQKPQTVTLKGLDGNYTEFRGDRTFSFDSQSTTFNLQPLEVVIGTTSPRGRDLPTYGATQALIDRLEAERLGRDNQILEKYEDVVFTASSPIGGYKLIDGIRDVWGWSQRFGTNIFVEVSFPKKARTFKTVRVFGRWKNDPVVSVRQGGAWVRLAPAATQKTKNGIAFDFAEPVRTLKVRISFLMPPKKGTDNPTELYEIELGRQGEETGDAAAAGWSKPTGARFLLDESNAVASEKYGAKTWMAPAELVSPRPAGGFTLLPGKGNGATVLTAFGPESKYLTARLETFDEITHHGYKNWSIHLRADGAFAGLFGGVTQPQPGLYIARLPAFAKKTSGYLRFYDYNFKIGYAYAAIEEDPADLLVFTSKDGKKSVSAGDVVRVSLRLKNPCEEVAASFVHDAGGGGGQQPYAINGTATLPMTRRDGEGRVWDAELTLKNFKPVKGRVYAKVVTLGGGYDLPIFAANDFAF